jgi:hypothetical protein
MLVTTVMKLWAFSDDLPTDPPHRIGKVSGSDGLAKYNISINRVLHQSFFSFFSCSKFCISRDDPGVIGVTKLCWFDVET